MRTYQLLLRLTVFASAIWFVNPMAYCENNRYLEVELPSKWSNDSTFDADASNIHWWKGFGDSLLDSLVARGRTNNYNVSVAIKRIELARAGIGAARSAYFPTVGVDAGWSRNRTSGVATSTHIPVTIGSAFNASVTASWEIDIFGKVHSQVQKAKANEGLSAAEAAGVVLSLDAEIANTYIGLLVARGQLEVARRHAGNQLEILRITQLRHDTGLASKLDVAQATTLYYSTIAQIPLLEAQIDASVNSLAVLLGTTREQLPSAIDTAVALPTSMPPVGIGTPADLLRRRPDVVQAERQIDVAAAALGIARKDYLPSLSIQASVGSQAHSLGDLFTGDSFTYSIAPTLSWTIFDGLGRHYAVAEARRQMEIAIDDYNMAVVTAVEECRDAARNYTCTLRYIDDIEKVVESSSEEVDKSVELYKEGLTAFSNVVDAMLNYLSYQNTLVSARGRAIDSLINLYKALGGGWE